jgi:hypothetical protein
MFWRNYKENFMRKLLVVLFAIFICQAVTAQEQDVSVGLEITDIPNRYNGMTGAAFVIIPGEDGSDRKEFYQVIDANVISGVLKEKDGTDFKLSTAKYGAGYIVILIFVKGDKAQLTMYSKQFVITSDKIKLNFRTDFSPNASRTRSR